MITSLYSGILGILYAYLSFATIAARMKYKVSMGSGPNNEILHYTSAHSNFAGYAPILIIMLYLAETHNLASIYVHIIGACFTLGRLLHIIAFSKPKGIFPIRKAGMLMTLFPLIILSVINIIKFF